jgi:DNA-binding transcriptional LysR family regulator
VSLTVDDLRAFALVVEERSVTRAAARLGVSQQAASERIMRLERRLGTDLFKRQAHGMAPTAAAYRFLPYSQQAVALIDQAVAVVDDDQLVRVSVHDQSAAAALPFLEEVLDAFTLEVTHESDPEAVLSAVSGGSADVGLGSFATTSPSTAVLGGDALQGPRTDVTVEVLYADPVVCVAPFDHPLAAREQLAVADLGGHVALMGALVNRSAVSVPTGELRVGTRSTVAVALDRGELVELAVVDLPAWVVPVSIAFRTTDTGYGPVQLLRSAAAAAMGADGSPTSSPPPSTAGSTTSG